MLPPPPSLFLALLTPFLSRSPANPRFHPKGPRLHPRSSSHGASGPSPAPRRALPHRTLRGRRVCRRPLDRDQARADQVIRAQARVARARAAVVLGVVRRGRGDHGGACVDAETSSGTSPSRSSTPTTLNARAALGTISASHSRRFSLHSAPRQGTHTETRGAAFVRGHGARDDGWADRDTVAHDHDQVRGVRRPGWGRAGARARRAGAGGRVGGRGVGDSRDGGEFGDGDGDDEEDGDGKEYGDDVERGECFVFVFRLPLHHQRALGSWPD
ncbi:hypothetical protein K438DRAFT_223185 [Mycena galopus ATCC 62051]|nr:hypothetical protein K438DRAFT_223185 [Mycena galopus ATCC 62051]